MRLWDRDFFVPKQLGWGSCLGLMCLSPAPMVRRRSRSSVNVRRRCHAVRHSTARRSIASESVVSACAYGLKRAVGFRGFQL